MASDHPLVSFVLVNWHTERFLPAALASIRAQSHPAVEIVLVDNGSPDFDPAVLEPYQPVKLVRNASNRGFAAANNQGIAASSGEFVILLNCDARLDPGFIAHALEVFAASPLIGTVVPKLLRDDSSGRLESTGHLLYTDRTPAHRGYGELDQGHYDRPGFVFGGSAAAIAYRRAMLDNIVEPTRSTHIFDESFFAYFEDVDLDWRARLAGWEAYYEPRCVAWHHAHGSGGRKRWLIRLRAEKNRYLMLAKNDTLAGQVRAIGPLIKYETYHLARWLLQPTLWPAPLLKLWHLPGAVARRLRRDRRIRTVVPRKVERWFVTRGQVLPPVGIETPVGGLVSAIAINYNGLELTRACLNSLLAQSYAPLEIIVVDNGSERDEAAELRAEFPSIRVLRLERNLGFTGGVNWGTSLATGELIALVNNDSLPQPDCIERMVEWLNSSGADAVSGRLINVETLDQAQAPPDSAVAESLQNHGLSLFGYIVPNLYGSAPECFYPSGGLCLLRHNAVASLLPELFPQLYFAYYEDVALGFALRVRGGSVSKATDAVAVHVEGSTARKLGRARLRFLQERNRWLTILGYYPAGVLWRLLPVLIAQSLLGTLLRLLTRPLDAVGMLWAYGWLLVHSLAIADYRARCRAQASATDAQWLAELSGTLRGRGGLANWLALAWCRLLRIPCHESMRK